MLSVRNFDLGRSKTPETGKYVYFLLFSLVQCYWAKIIDKNSIEYNDDKTQLCHTFKTLKKIRNLDFIHGIKSSAKNADFFSVLGILDYPKIKISNISHRF